MPRQLGRPKTPLARWLKKNDHTITRLARELDLAYRTVWLATHGYKVSYETGEKISHYTGDKVTLDSLCSGPSRTEFEPTTR